MQEVHLTLDDLAHYFLEEIAQSNAVSLPLNVQFVDPYLSVLIRLQPQLNAMDAQGQKD